jgi:hypothetical protein
MRVHAASPVERVANAYRFHRYALLFYTLLGTLAAGPILTSLGFSADVLQIFLAFNLLIAVLGDAGSRWRTLSLVAIAVVAGLRIVPSATVGEGVATGALALGSGVGLLAVAGAVRFALRSRTIEAEHVYAALSAYLLAGLLFGVLYWSVATAWPGSFGEAGDAVRFTLSSAIYFSFVTLATLGYGDVLPRSEVARGLAVLEAVGGQLYIAVTIARLVGGQRSR